MTLCRTGFACPRKPYERDRTTLSGCEGDIQCTGREEEKRHKVKGSSDWHGRGVGLRVKTVDDEEFYAIRTYHYDYSKLQEHRTEFNAPMTSSNGHPGHRDCISLRMAQRIETRIGDSLLYACRFWVAHFQDVMANEYDRNALTGELQDFLSIRLLFWLEVMSLADEVIMANVLLLTVAPSIAVCDF